MPLRDHFHPPVDNLASWEELHALWPAVIVQHLRKRLPTGYVAGPRVHSGSYIEIDVAAFKKDEPLSAPAFSEGNGGVATAVWSPPQPTIAVETSLSDFDEYEVRVYDDERRRHLVAAIEIVNPANKDRPEHRNVFIAKCATLLQKGVAVSIVDLVTIRRFNLYAELLAFIGHNDPTLGAEPPDIYAVSCRWVEKGTRKLLETWSYAQTVGQPLPTLPLWLKEDLAIPLDLEQSYEQACHDLWIA
ncbi:MAG TPA: DUF4058 family protein [Gemmataceae bacterium]|jgi:hypothetical protein